MDPDNRWLGRQNRKRLEAEALRDSLLCIGDALDQGLGGVPQDITLAVKNIDGSQAIGCMRRSVYLDVNRAAMSDFLTTFDYVEPGVSVDRRSATVVPHQSLFLMNHPMPQEIGKRIAQHLHTHTSNDAERLRYVTKTLFCREPTAAEKLLVLQQLGGDAISDEHNTESLTTMNSPLEQWIRICRSLLLTNEFLYVE
jgi:hypothetical protein